MKLNLCVLLMLCLLISVALAEENNELKWENVALVLEAGNVKGQFYTLDEVAIKIWLPDGLFSFELTENDKASGYISRFLPEDQSAQLAVSYVDMNGMSLDEYAKYLSSDSSATEIETGTVNGLPCIFYKIPKQNSVNVTFTTEAGYTLRIKCAPVSVENAELVWFTVISSIQAIE